MSEGGGGSDQVAYNGGAVGAGQNYVQSIGDRFTALQDYWTNVRASHPFADAFGDGDDEICKTLWEYVKPGLDACDASLTGFGSAFWMSADNIRAAGNVLNNADQSATDAAKKGGGTH